MRRIDLALVVAALLAPAALVVAQDTPPEDIFAETDPFDGRVLGERVEVLLKNGSIFRGELRALFKDRVKVDVTYESATQDGTMTFERTKVRRCRVLPALSQEDRDRIRKAKEARGIGTTPTTSESEAGSEEGTEEPKELTDEEKKKEAQRALLEKYPPEVWTDKRYAEIMGTDESRRSDEEKAFLETYVEWLEAKSALAKELRTKLLDRWPPGETWSEERYILLKDQFVVLQIPLTEEQQAFVESFKDWKLALDEKKQAEQEEADKKAAEEKKKKEEEAKKAEEEAAKANEGG